MKQPFRRSIATLLLSFVAIGWGVAQSSQSSLRFFGTGINQQDRVRIRVDDDLAGPDASAACDIGNGSFTIELWVRGKLADNPTSNGGGDREYSDIRWIEGNIIFDRDIFGGSEADFGVSLAGGLVRFGTGRGANNADPENTIEGSINLLDDAWHHVALVRDAASGRKRIYVDGQLDFESSANVSRDDLSYPNNGVPGQGSPWGPFIVLAAEKHDAGAGYPSFNGFLDELRLWNRALTQTELLDHFDRILTTPQVGLVGYYRFEEGVGTSVADSSGALSPTGELIAGVPGNGEWALASADPLNVAPVSGGPLPAGFARTTIVSNLTEPTVIEFTPDGRLLIAERFGRILIYQDGELLASPLIQIPVDAAGGERGLVGLTLDPAFSSNGYFYVYYTTTEPRNRVARFTAVGNTASLASEQLIWQNPALAGDYHHGGSIFFGPGGDLFIATGDQFDSSNSQNLANQHGKLLRVRPDGSVPPDNPFVSTPGAQPPIYAYGLRNPFRVVYDPPSSRILIGDVGGNSSDSWEELNIAASGANFGWPNQEGQVCYAPPCTGVSFPSYSYQHNNPRYSAGQAQGSITTGPVYRGTSFPSRFAGSLFFGDYANRWIRRLVFDSTGQVVGDPLFYTAPNAGTIVDLEVGPNGSLYFVTIGVPWSGDPDIGAVHEIRFNLSGNQPPIAVASGSPSSGDPPLTVQFSSAGSNDPDNGPQPLSYDWRFGDGGSSTAAHPQHLYTQRGPYIAELRVSDGNATSAPALVPITVGQRPTGTIIAPPPGTLYRAGDVILFSGTASDPEDGTLPATAFRWVVVLRHADHTHPFFGPIDDVTSGDFTIPTSGHSPENTYYEIQLTVEDSDRLTDTKTRRIDPVISTLSFDTAPSGIPFLLDGEPELTPRSYQSNERYLHTLEAQDQYNLLGTNYWFECWSDGGLRIHTYQAPAGGAPLIASYQPGANRQTVTATVSAANRDADHFPDFGEELANAFDAGGLCLGRESDGRVWQTGLQFALDLPPGTTIASARLRVTATADNSGSVTSEVRAYDVASAQPFSSTHTHQLTAHHPTTSAAVSWGMPNVTGGQIYDSPDLRSLVQAIVDRPDWSTGNVIGFTLDGSTAAVGNNWRCIRNASTTSPAQLIVEYEQRPPALPPPGVISGLVFTSDVALEWNSAPSAIGYDLLRGTIVSTFSYNHACLRFNLPSPTTTDTETPPASSAYYYLARARNRCGPGPIGAARPTPPCP